MQEKQEEMQKIFEKWDEIHEDILTSVAKVMELSEKNLDKVEVKK